MEQEGLSNTEPTHTFIICGLYARSIAKHIRWLLIITRFRHVQLLPLQNKFMAPVAMATCVEYSQGHRHLFKSQPMALFCLMI